MNWRERYIAAHKKQFAEKYPEAWKDGRWYKPPFPKVATANGLTAFICNFINWQGYRATRISSAGRFVPGNKFEGGGRFIPGPTRRGTADISATIKGRSVMIEVKVGKDKPSEWQLAEQAKERAAGGTYEFCHDPDEFLRLYDEILVG